MGHDIFAYQEIAYLRRGAFEPSSEKMLIYQILNVEESYRGVSGNGDYHWISKETLQKALETTYLPDDIIEFLRISLKNAEKEGGTVIHFG